MSNNCSICKYFDDIDNFNIGKCKRYPPTQMVINNIIESRFPILLDGDICGEFSISNDVFRRRIHDAGL